MPILNTEPRTDKDRVEVYVTTNLQEATVDKANLIIRNVVLLGSESVNTQGQVTRRYSDTCLRNAPAIFEGIAAYVDHPDAADVKKKRSVRDMYGTYRNVRFMDGKLRGDLDLFDTPVAHHVLAIANKNPNAIGNSIHAAGRFHMDGAVQIVEEILPRTKWGNKASVDLVNDPATAQSLFEETNNTNDIDKETKTMEFSDITKKGLSDHRIDLVEEIRIEGRESRNKEIDDLNKKVTELTEEKKTLQTKLDTLEVAASLAAKAGLVDELLEASSLPKEAKTDIFRSTLLNVQEKKDGTRTIAIKEQIESLIEDRTTAIGGKKGVKNAGGERKTNTPGGTKPLSQSEVIASL